VECGGNSLITRRYSDRGKSLYTSCATHTLSTSSISMASHGSRNVEYTANCSKCGRKITPQGLKRHEDACDDQREVAMLRKEMQESENQRLMGGFKRRREDTFTCKFGTLHCGTLLIHLVVANSPSAGYSQTTPVPTRAGASWMEASGGPETSPPSLMRSQEPMQEGSVAGGHPRSDTQ
jgi:hypothetical protein